MSAIPAAATAEAPAAAAADPATLSNRVKYLIFGVMAFGQFMALIDIQIVAASVNAVQAGLSAGPDEISWLQTAYLMAELVMIPFSAFLTQALSTRWLFTLSAGLFTISSALCGLAWDVDSMIVFRAIQGFVGGAMVPTTFATGFALFTGPQRAMVPAILGMVSVLSPTLGPTVGGWITDAANWRWIFYINLAPGILITVLSATYIKVDRAQPAMLRRIDWVHLISMATFLGALVYVLEEGPRHDWLDDPYIATGAWLSLVSFALFIERSFFSKNPIVRLTPFRKPSFIAACVFNIVIGFGMYASTYLVPVFLGRVRGYNSREIGTTVFVGGLAMLLSVPIASRLSQRVDPRILVTVGLLIFAAGLWLFSFMTPEWGFAALLWPQAVRGFAIMLCVVPSVTLALTGFAITELRYASGLFNLMRNLGGGIGIALMITWLRDQTSLHALRFGEAMSASGRTTSDIIEMLAQRMTALTPDTPHALLIAQAQFAQVAERYALTLAFNDVFRLMAWLFVAALVMVPFCGPTLQHGANSSAVRR